MLPSAPMDMIEHFMAYAADFEKTYEDDDWTRLRQYFTDDAVYEVVSDSIGCTITGPDHIFAGIKKSLDGFDRNFTGRVIALKGSPEIGSDGFGVSWTVTYTKDGVTPFVLPGHTRTIYRDGKIARLIDAYEPSVTVDTMQWMQENGMTFDGSYV